MKRMVYFLAAAVAVVVAGFGALSQASANTASSALGDATFTQAWGGAGAEFLPCEDGILTWEFNLAGPTMASSATLSVDGVTHPGVQTGDFTWSFTSPGSGVTTSSDGTPVWPFTSDAEAAAWTANPGTRPWAADPVQLTQHLLDDYLSVPGRAMRRVGDGVDLAVVEVSAGDRPVSQVRLVRVGRTSSGPWSVIGATSDDLTIAQPLPGEPVTSPMRTTGRVSGVDQSVHLQLRAATLLAEAYAPAGNELPWTQNLTWTSESWSVAALAASTFDGRGDLSAVTITAVRRGGASS